jgi:hypothetical protein
MELRSYPAVVMAYVSGWLRPRVPQPPKDRSCRRQNKVAETHQVFTLLRAKLTDANSDYMLENDLDLFFIG